MGSSLKIAHIFGEELSNNMTTSLCVPRVELVLVIVHLSGLINGVQNPS